METQNSILDIKLVTESNDTKGRIDVTGALKILALPKLKKD